MRQLEKNTPNAKSKSMYCVMFDSLYINQSSHQTRYIYCSNYNQNPRFGFCSNIQANCQDNYIHDIYQ